MDKITKACGIASGISAGITALFVGLTLNTQIEANEKTANEPLLPIDQDLDTAVTNAITGHANTYETMLSQLWPGALGAIITAALFGVFLHRVLKNR